MMMGLLFWFVLCVLLSSLFLPGHALECPSRNVPLGCFQVPFAKLYPNAHPLALDLMVYTLHSPHYYTLDCHTQ